MPNRTAGKINRKVKRSLTLSPESVAFLEATIKRRRADSISAVLDEILQAARREQERASLERAVASYYDSLSDEEVKEDADWGLFALQQFPADENAIDARWTKRWVGMISSAVVCGRSACDSSCPFLTFLAKELRDSPSDTLYFFKLALP